MTEHFINAIHKEHYYDLIYEDKMFSGDIERASLFYVISGNNDLYKKRRYIYNTNEHCIKNCLCNNEVDLSSGCRALLRLGFNLYNGWSDKYTTPMDLLAPLDHTNKKLAQNAMLIRFDKDFYDELND